jgi:pyruvate formate lyase activating enzyme
MSAPADTTLQAQRTVCAVCPHACNLAQEDVGFCGARLARARAVQSGNYGLVTSLALDPIEKKPLARFMPGSYVLSGGSFGCNLACPFCQNSSISRMRLEQATASRPSLSRFSPEALVQCALDLQTQGNIGLAFTYNEPLVGYEFVRDTAVLAHEAGLKNVLVTNGYANPGVIKEVFAHIDAANIDLKAFDREFYDLVGAPQGLETVKATIEYAASVCHVEVTTLVIPGLNDSPERMDAQSEWLASLDKSIPLHITRFHPAYKLLDRPPTPRQTVLDLVTVARKHLTHVYPGNL